MDVVAALQGNARVEAIVGELKLKCVVDKVEMEKAKAEADLATTPNIYQHNRVKAKPIVAGELQPP